VSCFAASSFLVQIQPSSISVQLYAYPFQLPVSASQILCHHHLHLYLANEH